MWRSPVRIALLATFLLIHPLATGHRDSGSGTVPTSGLAVAREAFVTTSSWLSSSWDYRMKLTAKPDSVESGTLTDFPLLLHLNANHAAVFSSAKSDGSDIRITKVDGTTVLDMEIVTYDPGTLDAEIWFEADVLSKTDNEFYIYYGNSSAPALTNDGGVWNSDYVAVYHFDDDPGLVTLTDYTANGNHASAGWMAGWTSSDVAPGQIGQAWLSNGTSHWIDGDAISTSDSSFVISTWLIVPTRTTDFTFQANPQYWHVSAQINDVHRRPHYGAANPWRDLRWDPNPIPDDDMYHYYTWVFDGVQDTILFYFDGDQMPATPWSLEAGVEHFYTGHPINPTGTEAVGIAGPTSYNSLDIMDGPSDEFRVSESTHTSEWIKTEYRNQKDPDGFYTLGPEEGPTPVGLLFFTAAWDNGSVVLQWSATGADENFMGFHVYRENADAQRIRISTSLLTGTGQFEFVDDQPVTGGEVRYWLAEVTRSGSQNWYGPAVFEGGGQSGGLFLAQNRPNPFGTGTLIQFGTEMAGQVRLRVFDVRGREVAILEDGYREAGQHEARWNGRDQSGVEVAPGIYFYRLETVDQTVTRKLVRVP